MRFIKLFLVGFTGLFVVITLMSLLIPFHIKVSRIVVMNAKKDKVYAQITNLKNWKNWHPVFTNDSTILYFSNPSIGKNAFCDISYHNKQTHLVITDIDSSSIKFLLQSKGERIISNELVITPISGQNTIRVEWKAITKLRWYPWEKFYGIFIDKITGPGYEHALNGLKKYIEAQPSSILSFVTALEEF